MSHWQLFIVGSTFVYMVIACGLYAWVTAKTQPYIHVLPEALTERFIKFITLITAFSWPIALSALAYIKVVEWMMKLAGIKWEELIPVEAIQMGFKMKDGKEFNAENVIDEIDKIIAKKVTEIRWEIVAEGRRQTFIVVRREKIDALMDDRQHLGDFLHGLLREKRDEWTDDPDDQLGEPLPKHPVAIVMTRAPLEDEIEKLEKPEMMRLIYAVAYDRAVACHALDDLEVAARTYAEKGTPHEALEKECTLARAVVGAWINLVSEGTT